MYKPQNYIEKPINVLSFDSFGHAILNYQAIQIIQSIQKPICILSIAGPYRTGKSFLLNSLIGGQNKFAVSSTTRSCTKGLWIWGKPITSVDEEGKLTNILVMDTQGFGSCEQVYDKRIIILALLLSTCFIFNSKGVIDSDSLKDLQYVIQQTKKVKKQLCFDSVTDFHWVLRDFQYQMVNQSNVKIEPDQYMEQSLKEYSNSPSHKELYKMLCQFFRTRRCHTLVTPETDPSIEQNPQFVQQLIKFKKILSGVPSLKLDGMTLTEIIEAYVSAMNENYTESGVEREGAECRLRINCLSKLCRELDAIKQEQPEKRAKLTKIALHEVEDNILSKMTSEKQIKILKEELNVIISQFEEDGVAASAKKGKSREPRNSVSLSKIKQHRVCAQLQQFNSQQQIKTNNKPQLAALQKIREELESKLHRYELQIGQINLENQLFKSTIQELETKNQNLEQNGHRIEQELRKSEKQTAFLRLQWQDQLDQYKTEHIQKYSELEKENKLLKEKLAYLSQKIAAMEIQQTESQCGLTSRYKEQIKYLENENQQLLRKYEQQIRQLKLIYQSRQEQTQPLQSERVRQKYATELSKETKAYNDQIFKLQEENSQLMMWKHQAEEQISQLKCKCQQIKKATQIQLESTEKKQKQKQANANEFHANQISGKQKIIRELEVRMEQQRKIKEEELGVANLKYDQLHLQMTELQINFEAYLKELKDQCADACEKYQLEQQARIEKEKQIDRILIELQIQRESLTKNYNEHYETVRKLREELLASNLAEQLAKTEKQQERQRIEQLEKELAREKDSYESYKKQLANIHQIDISRLEGKISCLTSANNILTEIKLKYEELQNYLAHQQQQKSDLLTELKLKQENIKSVTNTNLALKQENQRLQKIIGELTKSININQEELERLTERNSLRIQEKEQKYLNVLAKLHDKQKQCYLLTERNEAVRKQYEHKQKLLQKLYEQRLQQKNNELNLCNNNFTTISEKLQQSERQLTSLRNSYSLLQQRFEHLSQNYQIQVKGSKQRSSRQWQKTSMDIGKLQIAIAKLRDEKEQLLRKISMLQNDSRETSFTMIEMRKKYEKNMNQYETNMRAIRKRLSEVQNQNRALKQRCEKTTRQFNCLEKTKEILEQNYNQDFKLWATKIKVHEQNQSERRLSS